MKPAATKDASLFVRVGRGTHARIREIAKREERTMSAVARRLIVEGLERVSDRERGQRT